MELGLRAQFITSTLLPICPMLLLAGHGALPPHPSLGLGLVLRGASESGGLLFRNPPLGTSGVGSMVMVKGAGLELWDGSVHIPCLKRVGGAPR